MSAGVDRMAGGSSPSTNGLSGNLKGAFAILLLALAPQLIALLFLLVTPISLGYVNVPLKNFVQFAFDRNLLLIYTAPLAILALATAFLTFVFLLPFVRVTFKADKIGSPQDYFGGVVLIALALFAFYSSSDLPGMRGFQFGPGTAIRLFAGLMLVLGIGVTLTGLFTRGAPLERYHLRGPLFVTLSIITFAAIIRPLGLVVTTFVCFMIAAIGSPDQRWHLTLIVGIAITAFCCFLFPVVLGLPFQLKPRFMLQ